MTTLARKFRSTLAPLAVLLGVSLVGCKYNPVNPNNAKSKAGAACEKPEALLDDGEDGDNQTKVIGYRGGYWYTFAEGDDTSVWPTAGAKGGTFEMSPGGAEGSPYAARFKGRVGIGEGVKLAGMGMNFLDPKGAYDASEYSGVSFWAKVGPNSSGNVRIKIPDVKTDPDAGICSECYNDFGMNLVMTEEWQHYVIPFSKLAQLPGWGRPKAFSIDNSKIFGIQFQIDDKGQPFDIWVDQIRFTGCGE